MAKGGHRPGAGRPPGSRDTKPRKRRGKANKPPILEDIKVNAVAENLTPLEFMLRVMNDPNEDTDRRDQMCFWAAPYCHRKAEGLGKKAEKMERARQAASGKFAPGKPPSLQVVKKIRPENPS